MPDDDLPRDRTVGNLECVGCELPEVFPDRDLGGLRVLRPRRTTPIAIQHDPAGRRLRDGRCSRGRGLSRVRETVRQQEHRGCEPVAAEVAGFPHECAGAGQCQRQRPAVDRAALVAAGVRADERDRPADWSTETGRKIDVEQLLWVIEQGMGDLGRTRRRFRDEYVPGCREPSIGMRTRTPDEDHGRSGSGRVPHDLDGDQPIEV